MGREERLRKMRRNTFLSRIAQEDQDKFSRIWEDRIQSWASAIRSVAKSGSIDVISVFSYVDKAKEVLQECGPGAVAAHYKETEEVLSNEACRALQPHIGKQVYVMNRDYEGHLKYRVRRRRKNRT